MNPLKIYLTFDLEEFDIVHEFGGSITWQQQIETSVKGMALVQEILDEENITATFFTTAAFALEQPALIQQLAAKHEIASHAYWHSSFADEDLKTSRQVLGDISGQDIQGLRMPRMRQVPVSLINDAGYRYDSSINPTRLPGRYNFTHLPRTSFYDNALLRIPASVSPSFRLPLFWLGFKNYPFAVFRHLAQRALKQDGYLNLYFHPWEFADLHHFQLPWYVKKPSGKVLATRLASLIRTLQPLAEFHQLKDFKHNKALAGSKGFDTIISS